MDTKEARKLATEDGEFERLLDELDQAYRQYNYTSEGPEPRSSEVKPARARLRKMYAELKSQQQRLIDLVRYQRQELHEAGLINDAEYAWLLEDAGSVGRLETYDKVRAERDDYKAAADALCDERNALKKRVEELESELQMWKNWENP